MSMTSHILNSAPQHRTTGTLVPTGGHYETGNHMPPFASRVKGKQLQQIENYVG